MKNEDLLKAVGHIDDDLIVAADKFRKKKKKFPIVKLVAAVASICILATGIYGAVSLLPGISKDQSDGKLSEGTVDLGEEENIEGIEDVDQMASSNEKLVSRMEEISPKYVLSEVEYPEMAAYPDFSPVDNGEMTYEEYEKLQNAWSASIDKQKNQYAGYKDGMGAYYNTIVETLLANNDALDIMKDNIVCSPINIYVALSMLAEITEGDTRDELFGILGVDDIEELRKKVSALWNANYRDDGATALLLGNSLWLNQLVDYDEPTLDVMSKYYFASVYRGQMGSDEYNKAYKTWINNNTGGIFKDSLDTELDEEVMLALVSTIYFSDKWAKEFSVEDTVTDTFHAPTGDVEGEFITKEEEYCYYIDGEGYQAIQMPFETTGAMWIVLPDEDTSVQDIIEDDEELTYLLSPTQDIDSDERLDYTKVNIKVPKFSVSSELSLKGSLLSLGVDEIFEGFDSDFVGYLEVFSINHSAKVEIDEEGCVAGAYTEEILMGAAVIKDEPINFVADRPFMFVIKGDDGSILFTGVVNNPNE